jgi:phosphatidylserine decarboxylase
VLVGATIVGSMATVWHGVVNPPRSADIREWTYKTGEVVLKKGDEMARFLLGSTVVMLWPKNVMTFEPLWTPSRAVRMGELMGEFTSKSVV